MAGSENIATRLLAAPVAAGQGDRIAIREGDRAWTLQQLADTAARLATAFRSLRIGRGDRVAIYMRDSLETTASILGCAYAGVIAVPISELATPTDVRDIVNDSGAIAAIVHGALEPSLDEIRTEAPGLREVVVLEGSRPGERDYKSLVRGAAPATAPVVVGDDEIAFILYSAGAGAAGSVRGVAHRHSTAMRAFDSVTAGVAPMSPGDRVFSIVRLSTAYGLGFGLLFPLAAGAESVLLPQQPTTEAVLEALETHAPTVFAATPSVYRQLAIDVEAGVRGRPLSKVATCIGGAEDMPARVIDKVSEVLGADVVVGYGLTEVFQFVIAGSAGDGRPGACGRPLDGFDLQIVDDSGAPVGTDVIGTLQLRGPTLASGYWGIDESFVDSDGWFTTRDRFMRDEDGFYYHCGRVDHLFKVGGKWVVPAEVERALLANESVWECAVIGADDEDGLIKPLAFIVPNIGHDPGPRLEGQLREYVKNELAPYKYPRWIEFVDELPKGPNGKVLRYKLREAIRGGGQGRRAETAGAD